MTTPREIPILFSGPMVRAILERRKTVTRRVVKPQPNAGPNGEMVDLGGGSWGLLDGDLWGEWRCPYGQPGDRLYVRETWAYYGGDEYLYQRAPENVIHRATWETDVRRPLWCPSSVPIGDFRWRPSIFMPKWAARIWLEVTSVRVERVHEITGEDARAEGVEGVAVGSARAWELGPDRELTAGFADLWDSINGKRAPWVENRWVWVVSFRLIEEVTS